MWFSYPKSKTSDFFHINCLKIVWLNYLHENSIRGEYGKVQKYCFNFDRKDGKLLSIDLIGPMCNFFSLWEIWFMLDEKLSWLTTIFWWDFSSLRCVRGSDKCCSQSRNILFFFYEFITTSLLNCYVKF